MISINGLREHLAAAADELHLPLTHQHIALLTDRLAVLAAQGSRPQRTLHHREHVALVALASGESAHETSRRLGIPVDTVKGHRRTLYRALGVDGAPQAVAVAIDLGLLRTDNLPGGGA
mgnify:FL=1